MWSRFKAALLSLKQAITLKRAVVAIILGFIIFALYQIPGTTPSNTPGASPTSSAAPTPSPTPCVRYCPPQKDGDKVPLSTVVGQIKLYQVESVVLKGNILTVTLKDEKTETSQIPVGTDFILTLRALGVTEKQINSFEYDPQAPSADFSSWIIMGIFLLVIVGFVFWSRNRSNKAPNSDGRKVEDKNKSQVPSGDPGASQATNERVTFNDVAGVDEAKQELQEQVDFLKNPERFSRLGARMPRGVLLVGPPGTGKTLLARAVAGEADVSFFSVNGSEFVRYFVGAGADKVRQVFDEAKKKTPCVVFIDEIDSLGAKRGGGISGGGDREYNQTLNQLLAEMDGFDKNSSLVVMAATNRIDILDEALLRPGRFDRHVFVDKPDFAGRKAILKIHAKGKKLSKAVKLGEIAKRTPGFSGADLANILNEAAIFAARRGSNEILPKDVDDAIDRVVAGPEKKTRILTPEEKKLIAWHECGHAVARFFASKGHAIPSKVSIIARGRALGLTWYYPEHDVLLQKKSDLMIDMASAYGGFVAEDILLESDVTNGPSNDIKQGTHLARRMVTDFAMGEDLPTRTFDIEEHNLIRSFSQETQDKIDNNIAKLIDEAKATARHAIEDHQQGFESLVDDIIRNETLAGDELLRAFIKNFAGTEAARNAEIKLNQQTSISEEDDKEEADSVS
ncbi:MAG: hypothetical protein A3A80_00470 [Candidatus Terrybacteria bacterium RIFCSPLOWO2_01_FULL_44_24]|uniref:ATP-dependent zinc metalloprotease FtsH n=1 Tax=Candidatus Terrybacteria bacterium RIFCSPHIGHO2_01_FULL_43_35 TaxID=1802361 RepID=A0A1G2PDS0_9BACT|nr:MAG: hypothetical protein A2828_01450 [Candidatus Terrybacteria bacterium RIFCSPHIGHO2_01_FULL_43_35]OHA49608.1 MAG: hypothetical protein A3B75_00130 [Candidatus Terrybacteria bacterium RIFCSPHIGHO2_02_FULL_43_14]OHA51494.1 MAG: hypothetical protein A3A80_00470 [Candidatus Terrybacteria bacterium RIFCSPLOWO2_01_FULL_44_24]